MKEFIKVIKILPTLKKKENYYETLTYWMKTERVKQNPDLFQTLFDFKNLLVEYGLDLLKKYN